MRDQDSFLYFIVAAIIGYLVVDGVNSITTHPTNTEDVINETCEPTWGIAARPLLVSQK